MKTALILIIAFIFIGLTSGSSDFENKINGFLKNYSADFVLSKKDNLEGTGQQFALEKINPTWKRKITLKSKVTIQNKYKQPSYERLYLAFYKFEDQKQCTAAMDTLLNCFGGDCFKIKWGVTGQTAKTTPCLYIFNETEIISCHISCETENEFWPKFKRDLEVHFSHGAYKVLEAGSGGPLNFREEYK